MRIGGQGLRSLMSGHVWLAGIPPWLILIQVAPAVAHPCRPHDSADHCMASTGRQDVEWRQEVR